MVGCCRFLLVVAAAAASAALSAPRVLAQAPAAKQGVQCTLRGNADMPVNLPIYDGSGQVVARFSGGESSLLVSEFPSDASGKVKIETALGGGGFRIRGQIELGK